MGLHEDGLYQAHMPDLLEDLLDWLLDYYACVFLSCQVSFLVNGQSSGKTAWHDTLQEFSLFIIKSGVVFTKEHPSFLAK